MPNWSQWSRRKGNGQSKLGQPHGVRLGRPFGIFASLFTSLFIVVAGHAPAQAAELIMFESASCTWCETWDREIAPTYPKTTEARIAPLRRVDIDDQRPADLLELRPVIYTPTFVLMHGGKEIGRIQGYPGEDFFWALLDELIGKLPRALPGAQKGTQLSSNDNVGQNVACRTTPKPDTNLRRRMSC